MTLSGSIQTAQRNKQGTAAKAKSFIGCFLLSNMQIHMWGLHWQQELNSEGEICSAVDRSKDYIFISNTCNALTNYHTQFIVHFSFVSGGKKLQRLILRIEVGCNWVIIRQTWSFQSYTTSNTQYSLRENLPVVFCQWCNCVWTLQKGNNRFSINNK